MVVLLIVMGIGAVWMTAAVPNSRQRATREKEAELVFRGRQYVRALSLFERKNGPGAKPPSIDILVDNKFLRKKYKDPITNDDFVVLFTTSAPVVPGQAAPGQQPGRAGQPAAQPPTQPGRGGAPGSNLPGQTGQPGGSGVFGGQIVGVVSKSTATSIMVFAGATHYNEWQFVYQGGRQGGPTGSGGAQGPGRGGPGGAQGPGRGGPGGVQGPGIGGGPNRGGGPGGVQPGPGRGGGPVPTGPGRGRGGN